MEIPDEGAEWILRIFKEHLSRELNASFSVDLMLFQNPVVGIEYDLGAQDCYGPQHVDFPEIDITNNSLVASDLYEATFRGYGRKDILDDTWSEVSDDPPYNILYPPQTFVYNSAVAGDDCNVIYGYAVLGYLGGTDRAIIWIDTFETPVVMQEDGDRKTVFLSMCVDERPSCEPDACDGAQTAPEE